MDDPFAENAEDLREKVAELFKAHGIETWHMAWRCPDNGMARQRWSGERFWLMGVLQYSHDTIRQDLNGEAVIRATGEDDDDE